MSESVRPRGVTIKKADGQVIPCELKYNGVNDAGHHEWEVLTEMNPYQGDLLWIDFFPANTSIVLPTSDFKEQNYGS